MACPAQRGTHDAAEPLPRLHERVESSHSQSPSSWQSPKPDRQPHLPPLHSALSPHEVPSGTLTVMHEPAVLQDAVTHRSAGSGHM